MRATTFFKEFVTGIYENDMSDIEGKMEPLMFSKVVRKVDDAHKVLRKQGLELRSQNLRGPPSVHGTSFFLYNVENFVLCGDIGIDREKNKPESAFIMEENQDLTVNER